MSIQYPAAVLWDMDGTIIDTEPAWIAAERSLVESFGGRWSVDDGQTVIGFGLMDTARLLRLHGVDLDEEEIVERLTDSVINSLGDEMPWRPGALELLAELHEAGVKQALVTMSVKRMAEHVVSRVPFPAFSALVTGDAVTHSKPDAEPYLRAAQLLGVEPAHCVAIEDSPPGVASAIAAGTVAIGVPHQADIGHISGYQLWSTLAGRGAADIAAEYERRTDEPGAGTTLGAVAAS